MLSANFHDGKASEILHSLVGVGVTNIITSSEFQIYLAINILKFNKSNFMI